MNHPTHTLRDEHRVILKVLDCFEIALRRAGRAGVVAAAEFQPFVGFFRDFADRCHHCKEEDRLFPCLERCGLPHEHGPIAVMLHEHQIGRTHVRAIAAALGSAANGDEQAINAVIREGQAFVELLRNHILKEDQVLFQMADDMIPETERTHLANEYAQADGQQENRVSLTQCRDLAAELCTLYGVPRWAEHEVG